MRLKKLFTAAMAAAMVSFLLVMPVSAHGHHGHHDSSSSNNGVCPVCTVEGCIEIGRHTHDGEYYCGYDHKDGYCDYSCERTSHRTISRRYCGGSRHHHN